MKRITTAVVAGAAVATLAYASASVLDVESKPLQAGSTSVTCDEDGVLLRWGLETDDNSVRSVTVTGIDDDCRLPADGDRSLAPKVFVSIDGGKAMSQIISGTTAKFDLPVDTRPEMINDVKVWIG